LDDSLPLEIRDLIGWQTTERVLPYRLQDRYTRQRVPREFRSIILENEYLIATFLPELGGRLYSLFDKTHGRELLARNPVFQPANLAIRNAWFSGGIEWNVGRFGHSALTCSPVFAAEIADWNGDPGLRLYEFERTQCLLWQTDFFLPTDSELLLAHTRVVNPRNEPTSMYWWTNIAVREAPDVRVLTPARQSITLDLQSDRLGLDDLPMLNSFDATYATNSLGANEFYMLTQAADLPWIAALDGKGYGLVEVSTPHLSARKLFCWGMKTAGRHWQEYLSMPGEAYIEIQAGLAPTQLHGLVMPAQSSWSWMEVFGALEANPDLAHSVDWSIAWKSVDNALKHRISAKQLAELERLSQQQMDAPALRLLHQASGWGALEAARLAAGGKSPFPSAFAFPVSTLDKEQHRWLTLLTKEIFPTHAVEHIPGEWMTQREWRVLLEHSLSQGNNRHWFAWLHLGIMQFEAFDEFGAEHAWLESIALQPSVWAHRNLGALYLIRKQFSVALTHYARAWELAQTLSFADQTSLTQEYLDLLRRSQRFEQAAELYRSLPAQVQCDDRLQIIWGQIALALNDLDTVDTILQGENVVVRENETSLADMWYELAARRLAAATGRALDTQLRLEVRQQRPPYAIDF
jgi:tetratricopeptide (TPR) repeat protein